MLLLNDRVHVNKYHKMLLFNDDLFIIPFRDAAVASTTAVDTTTTTTKTSVWDSIRSCYLLFVEHTTNESQPRKQATFAM